jgi:glycosyltransferase involved in cell wall biosynthesis
MKLCIPPTGQEHAGGSATFRQMWLAWLTEQAIPWTEDPNSTYDILFVNAWQTRYPQVFHHKNRLAALRVVHRVDGAGKDYGRTDGADAGQEAVSTLADLTIFQSHYSRTSTLVKHRVIKHDGPVIYNPVDTQKFSPEGIGRLPVTDHPRVVTAIWSTNRRKGGWRVPLLAKANPEVDFLFIGDHQGGETPPNLHYLPRLPHAELPAAMRSGDIFLNLSENDPCPNIVLEAMACGLPVLYAPSGGTPELVGDAAGLPLNSNEDFPSQFGRIKSALPEHKAAARERVLSHFSQEIIFPAYWEAIQKVQRRPLPSITRHWFSLGQRARVWLQDKVVNYRDIVSRG